MPCCSVSAGEIDLKVWLRTFVVPTVLAISGMSQATNWLPSDSMACRLWSVTDSAGPGWS